VRRSHAARTGLFIAALLGLSGLAWATTGAAGRSSAARLPAQVERLTSPATANRPAVRLSLSTTVPPARPPSTPVGGFPTLASAGVPVGWQPVQSVSGSYVVRTAGAVVQDLRVNGSIVVAAPNVTLRRVEVIGGSITNGSGSTCQNGLVIEDSTVRRASGQTTSGDEPAVGVGGYTARNVKIDGLPEGFRVGGKNDIGCGPVVIEDSYARVVSPDVCGDWHGDGVQGYDGAALRMRNSVLVLVERSGCGGTAPFFYPGSQGNTSVDIDGLIVEGGGASFRLGTSGTVRTLKVVDGSWYYGPLEVQCSLVTSWSAQVVRLDANGQPVTVRNLNC
jgi:hypothetical protein